MHFRSVFIFAAALVISASANAHDYKVGDLRLTHPHARTTVPGQSVGAAYIDIENTGKSADRLIALTSPIAKRAEVHSMSMEGDVMKMREVRSVDIAPSGRISMTPGNGYHIMLMGLRQPLKAGDKFPLMLRFEKSGITEVSVWVEDNQ